jgi:hypothetical protein
MNLGYNDAVAIRRELRNAKRILSNPNKFSASLLELAWKAKESAEKFHGIYLHQKLFQETCVAYGALVPFPASKHKVDS